MSREFNPGKISIRTKIFGIAIFLIFLMAVISVFSFMRIQAVRKGIDIITRYQYPIMNLVTNIRIRASAVELIYQEGLQVSKDLSTKESQDRIRIILDSFSEENQNISTDMQEALRLNEKILQHLDDPERVKAFEYIGSMLKKIESAHHEYISITKNVIDSISKNDLSKAQEYQAKLIEVRNDGSIKINETLKRLKEDFEKSAEVALMHEYDVRRVNTLITAISLLLGLLGSYFVTTRIVKPLFDLVRGVDRVGQGELDVEISLKSRDEVGKLGHAFNNMTQGLRLKERIKETFGRYMDPRIVEGLIDKPSSVDNAGEERTMTIFFSDIKGFTSISEHLTPHNLVKMLNHYLSVMSEPISNANGVIDKYIGDAIMAFWGKPFTDEISDPIVACDAALVNLERLESFRKELPAIIGTTDGLDKFDIRIGIATGEVIIGNIGSNKSKSYTVIGDTVNLAARLESINKQYGTRIIINDRVKNGLDERFTTREMDLIQVAGKSKPVKIFELMGKTKELPKETIQLKDEFERGLFAYREADWNKAEASFNKCLEINKHDQPSKVFLNRIKQLRENAPADWIGVWKATSK